MGAITRPARTSLRRGASSAPASGAPRVSVVTPTFNRAELVGCAIDSVLAQTFRDFELVVVDDCSQDNTAEVVSAIVDPRLRLLRLPKNGGLSRARNAGIAEARGEWVAFLDDDDEWYPQMLERQLERIDRSADPRTSVAYCLRALQTRHGLQPSRHTPPLPEGDVLDSILRGDHQMSSNAHIVKRSALLEVGGFDETLRAAEDKDLWLRLARASHHFVAVPETLAVVHRDYRKRRPEEAVGLSRSFASFERRWGRLVRRCIGPAAHAQSRMEVRQSFEALHPRYVERLVRRGRRAEAWRYVRSMAPTLPTFRWGIPYVAKAMLVVVFGKAARRLPSLQGEREEPKARKALGRHTDD